MFVALRDIAYARGRFALMTAVVGLLTLLLVMLTGLTGGLSSRNTSALAALDPKAVVFSSDKPSFTESGFTAEEAAAATRAAREAGAILTPLGTSQTRLTTSDSERAAGVAVLGLPAGYAVPGTDQTIPDDAVVVSQSIADDLGVEVGDKVGLGGIVRPVAAVVPDLHFAHSPVVWAPTATWAQVAHMPGDAAATVLLADRSVDELGELGSALAPAGTAVSLTDAYSGLPSYASERGSLLTMQGFLYAIAALVTVAFLSVWTIQRTRDLSILRALGASRAYLLKDALSQASLVLAAGAAAGAGLGWALGLVIHAAAGAGVPFALSWTTVALPAAGIWALGMAGALIATRRVTTTDPMRALEGATA